MRVCRMETVVFREAKLVLGEERVSYLEAMRDGGYYFLICFGFHRSQDAYLAPCTHHPNHGCACNQRRTGYPFREQPQLPQQRELRLAEAHQQQYLRIQMCWDDVGRMIVVGSYGLVRVR